MERFDKMKRTDNIMGWGSSQTRPKEITVPTYMMEELLEFYYDLAADSAAHGRVEEAKDLEVQRDKVLLLLEERGVIEIDRTDDEDDE